MGALDDWIAGLGQGGSIGVVLLVAVLLGLRHATDPDHLTAVSTLIVADRRHGTVRARRLGLAWGAGHATTLLVFGLPIVLFGAYLPEKLQSAAELTIGLIIAVLAVRLLLRWRRGALLCHDDVVNGTPATAYGIGLVHGVGGSAGVGVILLSAISSEVVSAAALALFAVATAVSMALASALFGLALARGPVRALAPVIGSAGLLFGAWYAFAAL